MKNSNLPNHFPHLSPVGKRYDTVRCRIPYSTRRRDPSSPERSQKSTVQYTVQCVFTVAGFLLFSTAKWVVSKLSIRQYHASHYNIIKEWNLYLELNLRWSDSKRRGTVIFIRLKSQFRVFHPRFQLLSIWVSRCQSILLL